jgi:Tfp pilus assembly protein PilV
MSKVFPDLATAPRRVGCDRSVCRRRALVALAVVAVVVLVVGLAGCRSGSSRAGASSPGAAQSTAQSSAQAQASAMAAASAFQAPTAVASTAVPHYAGSLTSFNFPGDLSVTIEPVTTSTAAEAMLADQFRDFLKSWIEAWASGNVKDPKYAAWCVAACHAVTDPTVKQWSAAGLVPAGDLKLYNIVGGFSNSADTSAETAVCVSDTGLTAVTRSATKTGDPFIQGPTLYVFGLLYDAQVGHWVVTEGYSDVGDSYCNGD